MKLLVDGQHVSCELLIIRHPWVLEVWNDKTPNIDAKNIHVVINQPPFRNYGPNPTRLYDIRRCAKNLEKHFGTVGVWHPIGPLVREALVTHHIAELSAITLSEVDWVNIIDVDEWRRPGRPSRGEQIRIGRHARDHNSKWPSTKNDILRVYPNSDRYNVVILGGAKEAERILGGIPRNWTVLGFDELNPKEYLADLDVFVYFTHREWVKSFGRVIIEAMAAGVPVILPAQYRLLFRDAALYALPKDVLPLVDELMNDDALYERQINIAAEYVRRNFGHSKHAKRVMEIIKA